MNDLGRGIYYIAYMEYARLKKGKQYKILTQWIFSIIVLLITSNVIAGNVPKCFKKTHKIVIRKTIPAGRDDDNYVALAHDYIIVTKLLKNSNKRLILLNDITVPANTVKPLDRKWYNTLEQSYNIQTAFHQLRIGDVKSSRSKIVLGFKMGMFWHEDHSLGSEYNSHLLLSSIMNRCLFFDGDKNLLAEKKGKYTEIKPKKEGVMSCDFTLNRESAKKLWGSKSLEIRVATDKYYNWLGNKNGEILSSSYPATLPDEVTGEVIKISKSLLAEYESKKCEVR